MADEEYETPEEISRTTSIQYGGKPLAYTTVFRDPLTPRTITFISEPPDRMLFHPDAITSLDPAYGALRNDGTLVLTATNGVATYRHTDAHQGCLVFERVSWEPK